MGTMNSTADYDLASLAQVQETPSLPPTATTCGWRSWSVDTVDISAALQ